ncbi:hypothetical protein ACU8V3_03285 [Cobetia marina]
MPQHVTPAMRHRPCQLAGLESLGGLSAVDRAGYLAGDGWVNQQSSLWGMPSLILWSYLIIFACSGAMLLGNRMLPDYEDGAPREDERASHE